METIYLIFGSLLLLLTMIDLIWTIFWGERGAGPITRHVTSICWIGLRKFTRGHSRWFSISGPFILLLTLFNWVVLLWISWTFIFVGGESILTDTQNRDYLSWSDQIYYVGYAMITLGIGDIVPSSHTWRIITIIVSASGMLFITMSASYVVSILSALNQKRSFAGSISGLGKDSTSIIYEAWNGRDFTDFNLFLATFASQLSTIAVQHNAYPILHYYHSREEEKALTTAVAIFDEVLTTLYFATPEVSQPNRTLLHSARSSVKSYIKSQDFFYLLPLDQIPPTPDLEVLRRAGLPILPQEEAEKKMTELEDRRRKLFSIVRSDARKWPNA
ncbi:potassium channel family protein [Salibacterium aidingense]|uniref:potassium channel family protein n=1 Tax=Salibacterium aidingense TaxID=384933 RepID=UPI003BEA1AFE